MTTDPAEVFPGFYGNPVIASLAQVPRWTVSDKDKRPIAIRAVLDDEQSCAFGVPGAVAPNANYLVTLGELRARLPSAANAAFFLDALEDDIVVLDVEPSCPPPVAVQLLRMPALYREVSMSGRGFHLIFPLPSGAGYNPSLLMRPRLQDPTRWYEVLQHQYVTFTRRVVDPPSDLLPLKAWDGFYDALATGSGGDGPARAEPVMTARDMPQHPLNATLLADLTRPYVKAMLRPLDDFGGDHSRHEFSAIGKLLVVLRGLEMAYGVDLEPGHEAWLIYEAMRRTIPPRPKHNETRGSRPLLLDRACCIVGVDRSKKETAPCPEP